MDIDDEEEENTKFCTNCKRNIKTDVYEMHVLHCHRKIKLCPVCNEPVPKEQMEEHHEDNHTEAPCDLCGQRIMKDQLEDHQTNDCRERKIECRYCQLEVKAVDFMEHTAACGSRTDVCDKCLTRLMLKDMDDHKCGEPPPLIYNQYHTPPIPRPARTRRAVRVDVDEVEQTQTREPEKRGANDVSDQLRRDEEMAAELQAQYTNEDPDHHIVPTHPQSPNPHLVQDTRYSPTTSPDDRIIHDNSGDLLTEQLQFEMRTGTRGQSTMALYNFAIGEEEKKKRNGDSPGSPIVLNEEEEGEREKEEEEEEKRREQLRRDEEMARQLQEEMARQLEEVENQMMLARFGQVFTHQNSPSPPPPPLLNTGGEEERRENEEEEGVLIPCEICREMVPFEDYQKHTNEKHSHLTAYVQNVTHPPPPPQRHPSPERGRTAPSSSPPTKHSPKTEDGDIGCSYCHFKYSPNVISYHETICDMNPDRGFSRHQLPSPKVNEANRPGESPLGPTRQLENLARSTDDSEEDDGIPCQFCEHLFPLSLIERHQKACPTRFEARFLERDSRRSPRSYDIFGTNVSDDRKPKNKYNSAPVASSATKKTSWTPTSNYGGASVASHSSTTQRTRLTSDPTTRPSLENKFLAESNFNRSAFVYTTNSGATGGVGYGGGGGRGGGTRGRGNGGTARPGAERGRGGARGTEGGTRGRGRGREGNSRGGGGGGTLFINLSAGNSGNKTGDNEEYGLFIEDSSITPPHVDKEEDDDDAMEVDPPYTESDGSSKGNNFTQRRK